ncbi:MAG: DJ-1/PfpI family protein [Caldilineaceae bacterium]
MSESAVASHIYIAIHYACWLCRRCTYNVTGFPIGIDAYHSLQTDLKNAGANWVDQEVVVDNGLVTSRNLDDIPAFNRKMVEEFAEGIHTGQKVTA